MPKIIRVLQLLTALMLGFFTPDLCAQPDADSLVKRGFERLRGNRFLEGARLDFAAALNLAPAYVDAASGLAAVLTRTGKISDAGRVLDRSAEACKNDTAALRYLSRECWRMGFMERGRYLDRIAPPAPDRRLTERSHKIAIETEGSRLENGATWSAFTLAYSRTLRPDFTVQIRGGYTDRAGLSDAEAGWGLFSRATRRLSLSYEGSFSGTADLLPLHRHKLHGTWDFGRGSLAGVAGDFASYETGWVRLGRLNLEQVLRSFTLRYAFAAGLDNFNEALVSHVTGVGWDGEGRLSAAAGAGYGNETVERYSAPFASQRVFTLFSSVRVRVHPAFGLGAGLSGEWRDNAFFRTLLSLSGLFSF